MEQRIIISPQPNCCTCGMPMLEWDPFGEKHEHIECASDRISDHLIELVRKDLRTNNT